MNNEPVAWIAYDEFGDFMLEATPEGDYPWQPLYTHPAPQTMQILDDGRVVPVFKTLTDEEIIESLAELEHQQWMKWADTIMQTEKISDNRFARWASCMIPYADLSEEMKEFDREWARKALAILRKAQK